MIACCLSVCLSTFPMAVLFQKLPNLIGILYTGSAEFSLKGAFEDLMGKGEMLSYQHFLSFPQYIFYHLRDKCCHFSHI